MKLRVSDFKTKLVILNKELSESLNLYNDRESVVIPVTIMREQIGMVKLLYAKERESVVVFEYRGYSSSNQSQITELTELLGTV